MSEVVEAAVQKRNSKMTEKRPAEVDIFCITEFYNDLNQGIISCA